VNWGTYLSVTIKYYHWQVTGGKFKHRLVVGFELEDDFGKNPRSSGQALLDLPFGGRFDQGNYFARNSA
jgi:hypothetical protein